jgi:hypothetical protein
MMTPIAYRITRYTLRAQLNSMSHRFFENPCGDNPFTLLQIRLAAYIDAIEF